MFNFLDTYPWLLPVLIFFSRIVDVSLGTMRIIFVAKGERYKAPLIGFVEVFIWVVIISQIFVRANDMISYLSYAAGYGAGNYVGILLEEMIAYGVVAIKIYTHKDPAELIKVLNACDVGATLIQGKGFKSDILIIETIVERKKVKTVEEKLIAFDPEMFYVIEDVRSIRNGIFGKRNRVLQRRRLGK